MNWRNAGFLTSVFTAWHLDWPARWGDRWRWLLRRWVFALSGFGIAFAGLGSWQLGTLEALWVSESQTQALRSQLQTLSTQPPVRPGSVAAANLPNGPPPVMGFWPVFGTQAAVWPQLERVFVQHGLRLLSLRPEPLGPAGAWPSQAVAIRLQARFDDWVAVWQALNARGPVWSIERLRITPQEGGVAIDAVLRLWLSPSQGGILSGADQPAIVGWFSNPEPSTLRSRVVSPVFVPWPVLATSISAPPVLAAVLGTQKAGSDPALAALERPLKGFANASDRVGMFAPIFSPDPVSWPLEQVRLAGVWQQAHDKQFILQAGPHWVRAHVGQAIGTAGHVVESIHDQEVHLRTARGLVQVIGLDKTKP